MDNIAVITREDLLYPPLLKPLKGAPTSLYALGEPDIVHQPCLSVVGTRKMTGYGRLVLERFIPELVAAGLTIVSGLAYGVDSYAHQLALKAKGKCAVVLGGGLQRLYPIRHKALFEGIIAAGGCAFSEYPPEEPPRREYFPQRNRIVAGLSQVTLIIEAGEESGTLITAHQAQDYGRDVCVVPADITRESSQGILNLMKKGEVQPVICAADILALYRLQLPLFVQESLRPALTGSPATLYDFILHGITTLDGLITRTGWTAGQVQSILSVLELDGYISYNQQQWQRIS